METVDDVLAHFGVKGMKWGVRKSDAVNVGRLGVQAVKARPPAKSETKKAFGANVAKAGGLHKVSDQDLQKMLNRLDMERRYTTIQHEDAAKRAAGRKAVGKVLLEVGKIALPVVLGAVIGRAASGHGDPFRTTAFITRPALGAAKHVVIRG